MFELQVVVHVRLERVAQQLDEALRETEARLTKLVVRQTDQRTDKLVLWTWGPGMRLTVGVWANNEPYGGKHARPARDLVPCGEGRRW